MVSPSGDSSHTDHPTTPHQIRVLVVDDNVLFREGLVALLKQYDDIMIAGQASNGDDAVRKATLVRPNVILMDISMANMGGVEATQHIHQEVPHVPIAMLT